MKDDLLAILGGMGDGVVVIDEDEQFLVFNDAAKRMMCFSPGSGDDASVFSDLARLRRADGRPILPEDYPIRQALRGEACDQVEFTIRSADGEDRCVSITARPLALSRGRRGAVGVIRDVTALRQWQQQASRSEAVYRAFAETCPTAPSSSSTRT